MGVDVGKGWGWPTYKDEDVDGERARLGAMKEHRRGWESRVK